MYTSQSIVALALLAATPLVSAHGLISGATGNLGGKGQGLGVVAGGANSQSDVTVFRTGVFGATPAGGAIVPDTDIVAMIAQTGATIPQIGATGGVVTMVYHQINGDGAGPITCSVSADATGKTFTPMTVTTNVPGTNGQSNAANADFPLVANMPAGTTCTGTVGGKTNVCIVKCQNPNGPFGGNVPVQMPGGSSAVVAAADTAVASATAVAATSTAAAVTDVAATSTVAAVTTDVAATSTAAAATATSTRAARKGSKKGKKGKNAAAKAAAKAAAASAKANGKRVVEWRG